MTRETLAREIDTARLADASAYDLADVLLALVEAAAVAKPTVAVASSKIAVHADIAPDKYWASVDGWMQALNEPGNSTWDEVAPFYAARVSTPRAAIAVIEGRVVTP